MSEQNNCAACALWIWHKDEEGECRLHAPIMDTANRRGVWPLTRRTWLCPDFRRGEKWRPWEDAE